MKDSSKEARTPFHHGDLRRALLDTARELLDRQGLEGLSLRKVAQAAGVSHAAPYHHFPDKAALIAALAEAGFLALADATKLATQAAGSDPFDRLAALGTAYIQFAVAHPGYFSVMFRPELARPDLHPCVDRAGASAYGQLVALVQECLRGSALESQAQTYILSAWSMVHGAAALWMDGPLARQPGAPLSARQLAEHITGSYAKLLRNLVGTGQKTSVQD